MSTRPIEILAAAFSRRPAADTKPFELARCAADALTDDAIVANAVQALCDAGFGDLLAGYEINVVRTVLRSVGGA